MSLYLPEEFRITASSFYGRSFTLIIRDKKLIYHATKPEQKIIRDPAENDWNIFWKKTIDLKIWLWNKSYVDHGSSDGQNWGIKLEFGKLKLQTYGSGDHPENYKEFLEAAKVLIGGLELH